MSQTLNLVLSCYIHNFVEKCRLRRILSHIKNWFDLYSSLNLIFCFLITFKKITKVTDFPYYVAHVAYFSLSLC